MRQYLSILLLMGLLTIATVSSTDCLYAYRNAEGTEYLGTEDDLFGYVGTSGYLDTDEGENVKFEVERLTKCSVIDAADYYFGIMLRIVLAEGPPEGETGWISVTDFNHPSLEDRNE
jgi:hypothetical protein